MRLAKSSPDACCSRPTWAIALPSSNPDPNSPLAGLLRIQGAPVAGYTIEIFYP